MKVKKLQMAILVAFFLSPVWVQANGSKNAYDAPSGIDQFRYNSVDSFDPAVSVSEDSDCDWEWAERRNDRIAIFAAKYKCRSEYYPYRYAKKISCCYSDPESSRRTAWAYCCKKK